MEPTISKNWTKRENFMPEEVWYTEEGSQYDTYKTKDWLNFFEDLFQVAKDKPDSIPKVGRIARHTIKNAPTKEYRRELEEIAQAALEVIFNSNSEEERETLELTILSDDLKRP